MLATRCTQGRASRVDMGPRLRRCSSTGQVHQAGFEGRQARCSASECSSSLKGYLTRTDNDDIVSSVDKYIMEKTFSLSGIEISVLHSTSSPDALIHVASITNVLISGKKTSMCHAVTCEPSALGGSKT